MIGINGQRRIARSFITRFASVLAAAISIACPPALASDDGRLFDYFGGLDLDPAVPSPEEFLGYGPGEHFSRHHDVVRYLETLAESSDRVIIEQYGQTYQRRSLHILTISSPANLARLDEILADNRELSEPRTLTDSRRREIVENNPAIAWLSYNVHGNEPSPSETAVYVAYTMAAAQNPEVIEILDDLVLVIDPMLNPDGHERYVAYYDNVVGASPIADPAAAEHDEPWPGGRTNHYLFDLNRDWLWMVHPESASRMPVYLRYLPHLHVDYHEQSYLHPYFFGAGDTPYHAHIPEETREWTERYGRFNAEVFDRYGLLYSSRERFDYLYPGYGKVTPCYHGAVGLLTEKAGHGRAGLAIEVDEHYTLTLTERAHHHFLTSMSYIESTAQMRREQLERFADYFKDSLDPEIGPEKAYIIHPDNDPAILEELFRLCDGHRIEIHTLDADARLSGLHEYARGAELEPFTVPAGAWVIRADQPMGRLVRVLFDRDPPVEDPDTYDITSWPVPVLWGLDAWYSTQRVTAGLTRLRGYSTERGTLTGDGPVAMIVSADHHRFPEAVGVLARHDGRARYAGDSFEVDGRRFPMGSLIIHYLRNQHVDTDALVEEFLDLGLDVHRASTGMTTDGPVLGANANRRLTPPRAILLRDRPMNANSYGQHWFLLDRQSPLPYSPINAGSLRRASLEDYNVLIIPDGGGNLSSTLGSSTVEDLKRWVRRGGVVIASGSSAVWANRELLGQRGTGRDDDEEDRYADEEEEHLLEAKPSELTHEQRRQRAILNRVPGPTMRAVVDITHPLSAGSRNWVGFIKRSSRTIPVADNGHVVARFAEDSPRVGGVISERNEGRIAGTPFMTWHRMGSGAVICFSDDPTVRGVQPAAKRLLLNAIIYGPSM